MLRVLLGPEGYWLLIVMACGLLARLNVPATARGNELLVLGAQWLPVFAVPLLFWLASRSGPGAARAGRGPSGVCGSRPWWA